MFHPRKASVFILVITAIILFSGPAAVAKEKMKAAPEPEPAVEEKAQLILDKTCKALTDLKAYSFMADVTLDRVHEDGSKIQVGRSMDVSVKRPGSFAVNTVGDDIQVRSVFDGKEFTLALPDRKVYGRIEAAMDIDALMDVLATRYRIESALGDLLSNKPCAQMDLKAGFYVGKARVGGAMCDHLFFQGKDVDWQLWVEDSPSALPRKVVITEKKQYGMPQFSAVLSGWKTGPPAEGAFAFTPPSDFTRDDGVITGRAPETKRAQP